jgi:hypothetical protein
MAIEFVQTADDLAALWRFYLNRMPERRLRKYAGFLVACVPLIVVAGFLTTLLRSGPPPTSLGAAALLYAALGWPVLLAAAVPVYAAWALSPAGIRWRVGRTIRRGLVPPLFFGRKRVAITDDGFRVSGDGFETFLAWRHLPRVVIDTDHLFLFQTYSPKGVYGHVVPRWTFASETDFVEFCRAAEDRWRSAHPVAEAS